MGSPGFEPRLKRVFWTLPDWLRGTQSLLYNGYLVSFAGVKRPFHLCLLSVQLDNTYLPYVKWSKVKVPSCYRPWRPLRESRGIALLFFVDLGTRWGWVVKTTPRPPLPRERLGSHCIGVWVGLGAGLDKCGKSRPHRDSIPGPSSP